LGAYLSTIISVKFWCNSADLLFLLGFDAVIYDRASSYWEFSFFKILITFGTDMLYAQSIISLTECLDSAFVDDEN